MEKFLPGKSFTETVTDRVNPTDFSLHLTYFSCVKDEGIRHGCLFSWVLTGGCFSK